MRITASLFALAAALGLSATAASAADMAPASYDWTGFYLGVNAGAAFNNSDLENSLDYIGPGPRPIGAIDSKSNADDTAFTGGALFGYNWQMDQLVLGLETDFNYIGFSNDTKRTFNDYPGGGGNDITQSLSMDASWFGTVRGRLGFAVDNLLFYGTGGLAYGSPQAESDLRAYTGAGTEIARSRASSDDVNFGWTAGAGIEYGIDSWSLGIEYLYVDLGETDWSANLTGVAGDKTDYKTKGSVDYQFSTVRATAKLRF
jgi:outer membrane immunogenic protein